MVCPKTTKQCSYCTPSLPTAMTDSNFSTCQLHDRLTLRTKGCSCSCRALTQCSEMDHKVAGGMQYLCNGTRDCWPFKCLYGGLRRTCRQTSGHFGELHMGMGFKLNADFKWQVNTHVTPALFWSALLHVKMLQMFCHNNVFQVQGLSLT